jgi:hypothetical protein
MGVRNPTQSAVPSATVGASIHASQCGSFPAFNKMLVATEARRRSSAKPGAPRGNIEKSLCKRLACSGVKYPDTPRMIIER